MALRDTTSVRQSVRALLRQHERVVLAISGGLDSMVLLDAAAATVRPDNLVVATFDHGTGPSATAAASLVSECAAQRGLLVEAARADQPLRTEAEWRDARWTFLREVATGSGTICTAHTSDDQIETVLMRVMRGAGARGLAGLFAAGGILRPLLRFSRRDLARYARVRGLSWIEDPSNDSRRFLRNRIRHEVLPALRRARPGIDEDLLKIARRAARWRAEMEALVDAVVTYKVRDDGAALDVAVSALHAHSRASLAVLWPALAAKVGARLDRRGTARLVAFTVDGRVGSRIQLSGGWELIRARDRFELRGRPTAPPPTATIDAASLLMWGDWSFLPAGGRENGDAWTAWLPADQPLQVRAWEPGDAMTLRPGSPPRKVKRFLSDAGVTGDERSRWPVVLAGDQIVWIPGIRRADAATDEPDRPGLAFRCEHHHR